MGRGQGSDFLLSVWKMTCDITPRTFWADGEQSRIDATSTKGTAALHGASSGHDNMMLDVQTMGHLFEPRIRRCYVQMLLKLLMLFCAGPRRHHNSLPTAALTPRRWHSATKNGDTIDSMQMFIGKELTMCNAMLGALCKGSKLGNWTVMAMHGCKERVKQ